MIREDQLRTFDATKTTEAPFVRVLPQQTMPAVLPTTSPLRHLLLRLRQWGAGDPLQRALLIEKRLRAYDAMRNGVDRMPR